MCGNPFPVAWERLLFWIGASATLALLLPPFPHAQAPVDGTPPFRAQSFPSEKGAQNAQVFDGRPLDVFVQIGEDEYQCYPVIHTTEEAPHETAVPVTYEPPDTFTPPVYASSTTTASTEPTPTPEIATFPPVVATAIPKVTPTIYPSATVAPPLCTGRVVAGMGANVRAGPGVEYAVKYTLAVHTPFVAVDRTTKANGDTWYLITNGYGDPGWIAAWIVVCE